jgi:hypothetical protein
MKRTKCFRFSTVSKTFATAVAAYVSPLAKIIKTNAGTLPAATAAIP